MSRLEKILIAANLILLSFGLTAALVVTPAGGNVPTGALIISTSSSCPEGYAEYTAARGRYIVGTPASGTHGGTSGTALSNLESRPAGAHTHSTSVPGTDAGGSSLTLQTDQNPSGSQSFTSDNGGLTSGTNAPYIQHLYCQKN
jgi:hypothetical protein